MPVDAASLRKKDYQQAAVIRRMVADLDVPVEVRVCPIVREPDGLAMSSRNVYLSPDALFLSSRRRHTSFDCDWSSDVCSSDLPGPGGPRSGAGRCRADPSYRSSRAAR